MLLNIGNLSILFLGKTKPDYENIQQGLSDGLHFPVFFKYAATASDFYRALARKDFDCIIAQQDFLSEDTLKRAVASGIPVICLLDAPDITAALELLKGGAVGCVRRDDPDQLVIEIYKALKNSKNADQKHTLKVAYELERLMRDILENFTDIFYLVDHKWRVAYINQKAAECWADKPENLLGRIFWDCLSHHALPPDKALYELAIKCSIPMQWESASVDRKYWVNISTYPTQNDGLAVFIRDITEKRHAEDALLVSRGRHAILLKLSDSLRLLDTANDIQEAAARTIGAYLGVEKAFYCDVVTIDGIQYFSLQNYYSQTGTEIENGLHAIDSPGVLASENWEGRNIIVRDMESDPRISDTARPSLREHRLGAWISVPLMQNGRLVASFTVHQAAARNWTADEVTLLQETTARTWSAVERVRAESALKKSEQHALRLVAELESADRNKNEFINALSHELRNPLAAIVASLSILDILDQSPDTIKPKGIIKRQTDQLCHLVDDLLDLTRITNNKIRLNQELLNLNELVQSSACDQHTLFEEKGIELQTAIGETPLYVLADPVRMSQMIGNLLHNACKFTDKGGKTVLTVCRQDDDAVITVKDSGIGIDASFLPDLFKTFKQAVQNKGGLGLGLSIVKGIIELHNGTVCAESDGLNRGTTITVRLPIMANPSFVEAVIVEEHAFNTKPLKILLIDDNRDLAEVTCLLLALYGYDVQAVHTGMDGIQKAVEFQPHVIICDIGLPDIDGYEVARRISGFKALGKVFLISLSGYAQASDFEYSREAGFVTHISKPVDFDNLKAILDSVAL